MTKVWGFEDIESAREYLAKYLLNYIHMELETLPKEEWEKTLTTWAKICMFASTLLNKKDQEREELYKKHNFDQVMIGIAEDVRHTLLGAYSLGILKDGEKPYQVIPKGVDLVLQKEELLTSYSLRKEVLDYIRDFFRRKR
ncbi:hypothetical protein [Hydrogenobacter hydrogenophilus]|uniref:Uncharacterized protein n=1 Tax=Hydrogenobacter hydrogenophilus TaxID=35835 RepID=A0A285NW80_9AQUI|nr:hypothetical protein [Hydrogenobacter hydrogenophilus]SNZ13699.1 hypothetical protein SAMN06265353_0858 [Hydrogenobacter hydrogenophilus]